jgi:hypothetical protein
MKTAVKAPGDSSALYRIKTNRRQFLWLSLGIGGLLLATPRVGWPASLSDVQQHMELARFARLLKNQDSAKAIGAAYLQAHPKEAAANLLLNHLVTSLTKPGEAWSGAGEQDLKKLFQQRIQEDFADEKVVKLQGWILSTTEARLCALTTLV